MMSLIYRLLQRPTPGEAMAASTAVHAGALVAAIGWGQWVAADPRERFEIAGVRKAVELEATWLTDEPQPLMPVVLEPPVEVSPRVARVGQQRFTHEPTTALRHGEMDRLLVERGEIPPPVIGRPRRTPDEDLQAAEAPTQEMALPRPPQSRVAQLPQVRAALPQVVGTEEKTPPRFVNNRPPNYPAEAIRRGQQGVVLLRLAISETGQVTDVEVARSSGYPVLDAAAVRAVRTWSGDPARRGDQPVATVEYLPVRFRLPSR